MRRRLLVAAVTLALPLAGLTVPAEADSTREIGIGSFADMVVDEVHGHVFISQGSGSTVVVTDLAGIPRTTIPSLTNPRGMALDDDGSTLYIAVSGARAIAAVDTTTLAVTMLPTGPGICPNDVAVTSGMVWFAYGCPDTGPGDIGALDPATGEVSLGLAGHGAGELEAGPQQPNSLIASSWQDGRIYAYDAVGGSDPQLSVRGTAWAHSDDLALGADGGEVITQKGEVLRTTDLAPVRAYGAYGNAVAARGDGMIAITGVSDDGGKDINLFQPGSTTRWSYYEFDGQVSADMAGRGLAFGSHNLYAITYDYINSDKRENFRLRVISPRLFTAVQLTTNKLEYKYGETAKITIKLNSGSPNRLVRVYATPNGGGRQLVTRSAVDASGNLQVAYSMKRTTTFSVVHDGDENFAPSSAAQKVGTRAVLVPTMYGHQRRAGKYYLFDLAHDARMKAKVYPNHAGECVRFRLQYLNVAESYWYDAGRSGCVTLNALSVGRTWVKARKDLVGIRFRLHAEWRRTNENLADHSAWRYFRFVK